MDFKQSAIFTALKGMIPEINPFLFWLDSYKASHKRFETSGISEVDSNFAVRFAHYMKEMLGEDFDDNFVVFGVQYMLLRLHYMAETGFFSRPKDEVIAEMRSVHKPYIGNEDFEHFEALHDLGYLPLEIKALPEGSVVPVGNSFFTIRNTHPDFEWLPNFLETGISTEMWKPLTVATVGRVIRNISNEAAIKTTGSTVGTEFQDHDFHVRGASGFESAAICGLAFLLSSCGTDNLPALWAAKTYYNTSVTDGLLAGSVPAGEHSVTTSGILAEVARAKAKGEVIDLIEAETRYARSVMVDKFPTGIVSFVGDSFDYWSFVTRVLPALKAEVMQRDGKFVVRGDSGNPVHVIAGYDIDVVDEQTIQDYDADWGNYWNALQSYLYDGSSEVINFDGTYYLLTTCAGELDDYVQIPSYEAHGTIECLWNIFGGTVNDLGYRSLDEHIGMIYGDGITPQRQKDILNRLERKGFNSLNIVFGIGSYTLNMLSRDHLGMAVKATNQVIEIDGVVLDQPIYKEPKTDSSKKSKRGLLRVDIVDGVIETLDMQTREQEKQGLLRTIYKNGEILVFENIFEIRERLWG